jgi:NTE family protein
LTGETKVTDSTETTIEQKALNRGADLVLEGGGVKGIGLVGAISHLDEQGFVFPRVGGTSAGSIVAALVAAYETAGVPLSQIKKDMEELDYAQFEDAGLFQKHTGVLGMAEAVIAHEGIYKTDYLDEWLHSKLDPLGIKTFGDLKITDDPGTGLPVERRYRLVVHASDLTRKCLVRIPWDLPQYLLANPETASEAERIAVIDSYSIVDAVKASMSIPFFFRPFKQKTADGECTWVDGGLLSNFPVTCFERTDGKTDRWPTFGIKLASQPPLHIPEHNVSNSISEFLAIAHTVLGDWNRYVLDDDNVNARTVWVDTEGVQATDFGLNRDTANRLYANGISAASKFWSDWQTAHAASQLTSA